MSSSPPSGTRATVAKRIERLVCLAEVDEMLLDGTPAADVAKYVHSTGEMTDVDERTLANGLMARKHQRQNVESWFGTPHALTDEDKSGGYRRASATPSKLARSLYKNVGEGIKHMLELEALYMASRDRIDRMMELESEVGAFSKETGAELERASEMIERHFKIASELGLIEGGDRYKFDAAIRGYSERTAKVLSHPEARRRILSLVERTTQHLSSAAPATLPMPKASGDK